jgi:hypothetical protein
MAIEFEQRSEVVVDMVGFEQVRAAVYAQLTVYEQQGKTDGHVMSWNDYPIDGQRTVIRFWLTQQDITDYFGMLNSQSVPPVATKMMSPTDDVPPGNPTWDHKAP